MAGVGQRWSIPRVGCCQCPRIGRLHSKIGRQRSRTNYPKIDRRHLESKTDLHRSPSKSDHRYSRSGHRRSKIGHRRQRSRQGRKAVFVSSSPMIDRLSSEIHLDQLHRPATMGPPRIVHYWRPAVCHCRCYCLGHHWIGLGQDGWLVRSVENCPEQVDRCQHQTGVDYCHCHCQTYFDRCHYQH